MGYPLRKPIRKVPLKTTGLDQYYRDLYKEALGESDCSETRLALTSILARTKLYTKTSANRQLALLDIDKILSFQMNSLNENDERVKVMRHVVGQIHQADQIPDGNFRQITHLVRLARLHFLSHHRMQASDSEDQTIRHRLRRIGETEGDITTDLP